MKYAKIYKKLNDNGKIDDAIALASKNGINADVSKLLIIDAIEYMTDFVESGMFKRCEYWTVEGTIQARIKSFIFVEFSMLMAMELTGKADCYKYFAKTQLDRYTF